MSYEDLLEEADDKGLIVKEKPLLDSDGRIKGNRIAIRSTISTSKAKSSVLAEELGHYYTSYGNILCYTENDNMKQEYRARAWAYDHQVGLSGIIKAYKNHCKSINEVAECLDVSEQFLHDAIHYYKEKYGICTQIDNYIIYFYPTLGIYESLQPFNTN